MSRVISFRPLGHRMALGRMAFGLATLALTGCSADSPFPGGGGAAGSSTAVDSEPDLSTQIACRQRVSEIYDQRNRGDIYSANSSMNTPYSANYQPAITSRGLADQFSYGQMMSQCERNTGTGAERSEIPATPASGTAVPGGHR
jgi:hypothetical protein